MTDDARTARRADATENDAAVLAAARRMITRDGGMPSIRGVAREAGVASTTVYRRFPTKEALHSRAVASLLCEQLEPSVARSLRGGDPMRGLRDITNALIRFAAVPMAAQALLTDLVDEFLRRYRSDLATLMTAAQADGALRPDIVADDIDGVATLMFAGLALPPHRAGAAARYVALLFDGLSREDAPPLPSASDVPSGSP